MLSFLSWWWRENLSPIDKQAIITISSVIFYFSTLLIAIKLFGLSGAIAVFVVSAVSLFILACGALYSYFSRLHGVYKRHKLQTEKIQHNLDERNKK